MKKIFEHYSKTSFIIFSLITVFFGIFALQIQISSDFKKLLPLDHPYLINMMEHREDLTLGNDIRIVVEAKNGTIFDADYLKYIQQLTDRLYALPSVDKAFIKSLWTPNARWIAVTEDGFKGGTLIPTDYDGSAQSLTALKNNIERSSEIGRLIADDFKSSNLFVPFVWSEDSEALDYQALNDSLEAIRAEADALGYKVSIIGVAKKIGELLAGAQQMAYFFLGAVAFIWLALWVYTSSLGVASVLTLSGLCGVIWQLGLISLLGRILPLGLDPYSMLMPFLVFAISVSHGLQLYNSACNENHGENIGWFTFCQLRKPAALALGSDALGFAALALIPIAAIRDLALSASLGVACLFFTTLFFVPLVLSLWGLPFKFREAHQRRSKRAPFWIGLSLWGMTLKGRIAIGVFMVVLLAGALYIAQGLQIGDLRPGAPELREDSQYNQDVAYFVERYSQSVDVYIALVRTPADACNSPDTLAAIDELQWRLAGLDGVQSSLSLVDGVKAVQQGLSEGFPKWAHLPTDQVSINGTTGNLPEGLMNLDCSFTPVYVFLKDHKATTLQEVTDVLVKYDAELQTLGSFSGRMLPAAGNAGIEAAVNDSIAAQQNLMLVVIYSIVFALCWVTFRRIGIVIAIIVPLAMTSLLCQALMAMLGIGVKVATLPVIALGVGIGVDYGVYVCARFLQTGSMSIALATTGRVVAFTGLALAISVGTWIFSAIQFQADMGMLLTFMFIWNMLGALFILPCLLAAMDRSKDDSVTS